RGDVRSFPTRRSSDLALVGCIPVSLVHALLVDPARSPRDSQHHDLAQNLLHNLVAGLVAGVVPALPAAAGVDRPPAPKAAWQRRSEEHTSELQSRENL